MGYASGWQARANLSSCAVNLCLFNDDTRCKLRWQVRRNFVKGRDRHSAAYRHPYGPSEWWPRLTILWLGISMLEQKMKICDMVDVILAVAVVVVVIS